jgi:hypothetical protein
MRCLICILFLTLLSHAGELDGLRGKVISYDADEQRFVVDGNDGKEYSLRWTSASKLADKKRSDDFANVASRGQDASFLLGYSWRAELEAGKITAQRGYLYDSKGAKKARMPDVESAVITGVLRPDGDRAGTLLVNDREFAVVVAPEASFVSLRPTIASAIFRSTEDVRVWASRIDGEFLVHKVEFYSGDWPSQEPPSPKPRPPVAAGLPGQDPPKEIRHEPAIATGNGFTRTISKTFEGGLPKAANVKRRPTNYRNQNNRHGNNRNNRNRNNSRNRRR